jgi:hypothetical protein
VTEPTDAVLIMFGDHDPEIPLRDVVLKEGAGALIHNGPIGANAGGIFPISSTTFEQAVAEHPVIWSVTVRQ